MTLSTGARSLLTYWGSIQSAATGRLGVAGAWQAVKDAGLYTTVLAAAPNIQDMNVVYGMAVRNRTAAETLAAATMGEAISAGMIGLEPNARTPSAMNAAPAWNVRVNIAYTRNGEAGTHFYTVQYSGNLPPTVTSLTADMQVQAAAHGAKYGFTVTTISTMSITAF